jgi:hypothetical protein
VDLLGMLALKYLVGKPSINGILMGFNVFFIIFPKYMG